MSRVLHGLVMLAASPLLLAAGLVRGAVWALGLPLGLSDLRLPPGVR